MGTINIKHIKRRENCQKVRNKFFFQKVPNKKSLAKKYLTEFFLFQRVPSDVVDSSKSKILFPHLQFLFQFNFDFE